jgi:hypothetical protein
MMAPIGIAGLLAADPDQTRPLKVIEARSFSRDADQILSRDQLEVLRQDVATLRQLGSVIKGSGGLRKMRCGTGHKGKRGGARVIYYYGGDHMPVFLVAIYAKSEKEDVSSGALKDMRQYVARVQAEYPVKPNRPSLTVVKKVR